ncbi:MAG TPA: protoheme IX farnesyltransferase [Cytophagales bacterium]|nr:protoheme IX farnesyltransferase [Cytophagales bacterium]HAA17877.1 protoheme IX farnesyltransferase [Cytophagales bacterium]HAP58200.1 protoheme IX farnesyltransferase [Cytophagales bacterium]
MRATRSISVEKPNPFSLRIGAYRELVKFRLSFLVAFSSAFGYALAQPQQINWVGLFWLSFAGFLLSGASITINQVLEQKYDAKMKRTQNRPLPTGKISSKEAIAFAIFLGLASIIILWIVTNPLTVSIAFISMVLYSFVYTPLKRVGPIAVFVGAIPGALPPLLGWTAVTGVLSVEALLIFGIQFVWQFPHFWAIAWVADEDYQKAGFKLLPGAGQKDMRTALQIMTYTMLLLPLGLLPAKFGITGINSAIVVTVCGVLFLSQTFRLMLDNSRKSALRIMFGSFLYLPIVQIAFLLDKM